MKKFNKCVLVPHHLWEKFKGSGQGNVKSGAGAGDVIRSPAGEPALEPKVPKVPKAEALETAIGGDEQTPPGVQKKGEKRKKSIKQGDGCSDVSILDSVTGFRANCMKLFLEGLPGLKWDTHGVVTIEGQKIEGSDIRELTQASLQTRGGCPAGAEIFFKHLAKYSVPEFLLLNPRALAIVKQADIGVAPPGLPDARSPVKRKWLTLH